MNLVRRGKIIMVSVQQVSSGFFRYVNMPQAENAEQINQFIIREVQNQSISDINLAPLLLNLQRTNIPIFAGSGKELTSFVTGNFAIQKSVEDTKNDS